MIIRNIRSLISYIAIVLEYKLCLHVPGSALLPRTQVAGTSLGFAWTRTIVAVDMMLSGRRIVTGDTLVLDNFNIHVNAY